MKKQLDKSKRDFLKTSAKVAYVAPIVLTLSATPALAGQGSKHSDYNHSSHHDGYNNGSDYNSYGGGKRHR